MSLQQIYKTISIFLANKYMLLSTRCIFLPSSFNSLRAHHFGCAPRRATSCLCRITKRVVIYSIFTFRLIDHRSETTFNCGYDESSMRYLFYFGHSLTDQCQERSGYESSMTHRCVIYLISTSIGEEEWCYLFATFPPIVDESSMRYLCSILSIP